MEEELDKCGVNTELGRPELSLPHPPAAPEKTNTQELTGKGQGRKKGKVDYRKVGYRYRES